MKTPGTSIALKLTVWFLLLSSLPLTVMAIFARRNVEDAFIEMATLCKRNQVRVLAAALSSSSEQGEAQTLLSASTGDIAFVVDENGTYTAHYDQTRVTAPARDDFSTEIVDQLLGGGDGVIVEKETGHLIAYSAVPAQKTVAVIVINGSMISSLVADVAKPSLIQLGISLVVVSVVGGIAIWLLVGRPVRQLTRAAEQIGAGDLEVAVNPDDMEGELMVLTDTFNQMTGQLRELIGGMEQHMEDLHRTEKSLRESEATKMALLEAIPDAIFQLDKDGTFIDFISADRFEALVLPGEFIGKKQEEVLPPEVARKAIHYLKQAVETREVQVFEYPLPLGEKARHYEARLVVVEEDRVLGIVRDITARVQAEEGLKRHRDHLEELVEARTRELEAAQAELVRKERLSALGQLTATVAHEIRNPLGTVRNSVFAIGDAIERNQIGRIEQARQLAERNILRCDNIITELLDYTSNRALRLQPTKIDEWLDALLDEQVIPESIVCARELTSSVEIPLDREHLRRAVINILNNGVDALQEEGARGNQLTVSTHAAGDRVGIRVTDTGCGIPADVMGRIFEPLFSSKNFGIGLGLPIVKGILEQHGGDVEIQSKAGRGTTITLWLPKVQFPPNLS